MQANRLSAPVSAPTRRNPASWMDHFRHHLTSCRWVYSAPASEPSIASVSADAAKRRVTAGQRVGLPVGPVAIAQQLFDVTGELQPWAAMPSLPAPSERVRCRCSSRKL
jgi:hypothetical protein